METAIEYLLKSAGVLSIFVLVYHFLLRRLTFFNSNRWFLLAGIAASILFPLIEITQTVYVEQPEQMVYLPQQLATPMASVLQQPMVEETAVAFDYAMLFFYLYLAISIFFIGKMTVELSSLRSLIRSGDKKRTGKFVIVTLSRKLTPFSFFNYICYSTSDQQSPELDLILEHEKVHAREWHSIDLIASHLFKALFWINPLVWLLKQQIGENLEFIADSKAKTQNTTGISYERTLLSAAASHMQPALANNFFTPFIKKRIVMLQKEASATWNAYKYALILPVIVLFLYSFNVVEEIEYIKKENAKTAIATASATTIKELVFDITSTTTDAQLEEYRKQIDIQAIYQVKFTTEKRDENGNLETIAVAVKYPNMDWGNDYVVYVKEYTMILLKANPEEMRFHFPEEGVTIALNEEDSVTQIEEEVLYGNQPMTTSVNQDPILDFDHTINFSIEPTSTKEYLNEKKSYLKKEYNVDFDYSKLKIKRGKIVRIKISIDDNNGYKGSQEYSATGGIKSICVKGVIKGDSKSWSMGGCKTVAVISENAKFVESIQDSIFYTIQNADKVYTDSIVESIYKELKSIENDSVKINYISASRSAPFKDSLVIIKSSLNFNDPNTIYTFESSFSNRPSTKAQIKRGFYSNENPPLMIVNGREAAAEIANLIDPKLIQSMTVLKNKEATSLYGNGAKNGVVLITTKNADIDNRRAMIMSKKQEILQKREEMKAGYAARRDSLISNRVELKEGMRAEMEERREAMIAQRDNSRKDGVYSGYTYNNGTYFYVSENNETQFFDRWGKKRFVLNKSYDGKSSASGKVMMDGEQYNFQVVGENFTLSDNEGNYYDGLGKRLMLENDKGYLLGYKGHGRVSTDSVETFYLTDVSEIKFNDLKKDLEDAGHTFKLKTHRMKNDRLVKLKFDIDGSQYAYQSTAGYKELKIVFKNGSGSPSISMIPFE